MRAGRMTSEDRFFWAICVLVVVMSAHLLWHLFERDTRDGITGAIFLLCSDQRAIEAELNRFLPEERKLSGASCSQVEALAGS